VVGSEADPAWPDDAVEVGRIVDAWGVKGWFKIQPHAAEPEALFSSRRWHLDFDNPSSHGAVPHVLRITHAREQGGAVIAAAQEIPDREAAQALKGARVFVSRASFPTPEADEFYWVDLIGLEVFNRDGVVLGRVTGLLDTGAHSVLRVAPEGEAEERMIPFVAAYIDEVDLAARRIHVDWGLDY
jgi:16S rRNA processing protein RimM